MLRLAASSLAGIGAVLSVSDAIITWKEGNPTKESAVTQREDLIKNRKELIQYKHQWESGVRAVERAMAKARSTKKPPPSPASTIKAEDTSPI